MGWVGSPRLSTLCSRNNHWVWGLGCFRPRSGGATKIKGLPEVFVKATDWGLKHDPAQNTRWMFLLWHGTSLQNYKPFDTVQTTLFAFLDTGVSSLLLWSAMTPSSWRLLITPGEPRRQLGTVPSSLCWLTQPIIKQWLPWQRAGSANKDRLEQCQVRGGAMKRLKRLTEIAGQAKEPLRRQGRGPHPQSLLAQTTCFEKPWSEPSETCPPCYNTLPRLAKRPTNMVTRANSVACFNVFKWQLWGLYWL